MEKFTEWQPDQESLPPNLGRSPEKVHQVNLPENTQQQEFFASEVGVVAGRDGLEKLEARASRMLADKGGSIAEIGGTLREALQRAQEEFVQQKGLRALDLELEAEHPTSAEYKLRKADEFDTRIREIESRIEELSNLVPKLEHDSLSPEDVKLAIEYLPANERMAAHMFLTRLDSAGQEKKDSPERAEGGVQKLSAEDLRTAADQESDLLYEALGRAQTDGERQKLAGRIDFYNAISGEIDRFSVWQKDHPGADWEDYLGSEYSRRYKLAREPAADLVRKAREKDLKLIQEVSKDFGSSVVLMKNEIRKEKSKGKDAERDTRPAPKKNVSEAFRSAKTKDVFRDYIERAKGRRPDQFDSMTVAIEGLKIAYPDEGDRASRLNSLFEAYNKKLQEQLILYPNTTGEDRRARNKAISYITNSVLIAPEKNAFQQATEREKQRASSGKGMKISFSTPLESSLEDLFGAIAPDDNNH